MNSRAMHLSCRAMATPQQLLIIGYPERLGDDHAVLLEAAEAAGVTPELIAPSRLTLLIESDRADRVLLDGDPLSGRGLAILPRGVNRAWPLVRQMCEVLEHHGARIVPSIAAIDACADKVVTTQLLATAGVPVLPTAAVVAGEGISVESLALTDHETVTKPARGSKARGVERHPTLADAARSLRSGRELIDKMVDHQVVQPLASAAGMDYRVVVANHAVVSITRRRALNQSFLTNRGDIDYTDLTAEDVPSIAAVAEAASVALGLEFGGIDVIEHDGRAVVLEANAWPGLASEALSDHLAVELVKCALQAPA